MSKPHKHTRVIDANVIIDNGKVQADDKTLIFCEEEVLLLPGESDLLDVLVSTGIFQSKGQARKTGFINLHTGSGKFEKLAAKDTALPTGFSEFWVGKLKHWITIWNPTE